MCKQQSKRAFDLSSTNSCCFGGECTTSRRGRRKKGRSFRNLMSSSGTMILRKAVGVLDPLHEIRDYPRQSCILFLKMEERCKGFQQLLANKNTSKQWWCSRTVLLEERQMLGISVWRQQITFCVGIQGNSTTKHDS